MDLERERVETKGMNARFRSALNIPDDHELRCLSWRGSLTGASQTWEHREFDRAGTFVGRYESWFDESSTGIDTGYRRYDPAGVLVSRGPLPPIDGG